MALTTALKFRLAIDLTKSIGGNTVHQKPDWRQYKQLTSGTGNDNADLIYAATRTLATTSENLDLAGGSLSDPFGDALTFVKLKGIYVACNGTASGNKVIVGGAAANAVPIFEDTTDKLAARGSGAFIFPLWSPDDGVTVTAGTGDILKVETNFTLAGGGEYTIVIIGCSA